MQSNRQQRKQDLRQAQGTKSKPVQQANHAEAQHYGMLKRPVVVSIKKILFCSNMAHTHLSSKQVLLDGPYGAPASDMIRTEHAVLISTGIGVTPFASILQSIMHKYKQSSHQCPSCERTWGSEVDPPLMTVKKVCLDRQPIWSPTYTFNYCSRLTSYRSTGTKDRSSGW